MSRVVRMELLFVLLIAAASARADDGYPYDAFVAVEGAEVASGPGHRFYATNHLPRGTKIEVYREEASGWLAIRPPEGAFSWLPAEFVERTDDRTVGRVTEATPAWIGTAAEQVGEHRQQVTLKEGELVQILGERQVAGGEGPEQTWLKIAPPAGEFRWIHLRDVSRQMPGPVEADEDENASAGVTARQALAELKALTAQGESQALSPALSPREREMETADGEPRRFEPPPATIALRDLEPPPGRVGGPIGVEQVQFRNTLEGGGKPALSPDGFVPRKRKGGSEPLGPVPVPSSDFIHSTGSRRTGETPAPRVAAAPANAGSSEPLARQLQQIETDLSLMLAQDRSLWDLAAIKQRVNRLVESGPDPVSRGRARLVLEKIDQFESAFDVEGFGPIAAAAAEQASSGTPDPLADPRYDGQGWLKPVVTRQSDKPPAPYALVDREGKPICFVTPSPGFNVHRYLNKQVGVYGRRGYIESLKAPHVIAERVIDLERQGR
jgi:hypothetical protein